MYAVNRKYQDFLRLFVVPQNGTNENPSHELQKESGGKSEGL